jgi:hypothetical protein
MKRLSALLLLFVYLASQFGAAYWYICKPVAHIYFSWIQEHSNKEAFTVINISHHEYHQLKKDDDEIMIGGMLYDVEETEMDGTMIKLFLKKDTKETRWDNHYSTVSKLLHKHASSKQTTAGKGFNIFIPLFHSKETGLICTMEKFIFQKHIHLSNNCYLQPSIGLITPPPKNC